MDSNVEQKMKNLMPMFETNLDSSIQIFSETRKYSTTQCNGLVIL